jgi:hypothetical protein
MAGSWRSSRTGPQRRSRLGSAPIAHSQYTTFPPRNPTHATITYDIGPTGTSGASAGRTRCSSTTTPAATGTAHAYCARLVSSRAIHRSMSTLRAGEAGIISSRCAHASPSRRQPPSALSTSNMARTPHRPSHILALHADTPSPGTSFSTTGQNPSSTAVTRRRRPGSLAVTKAGTASTGTTA